MTDTLLTHPYVVAESRYSRRPTDARGYARVHARLRDEGLAKHRVTIGPWSKEEHGDPGAVPLTIVWPRILPGLVVLDLHELPYELELDEDGAWAPQALEKGDMTSSLARLRLAVEPGVGKVEFRPEVELLFDQEDDGVGRFEGAVFDLDITIRDEGGAERARLAVRDIPMVERVTTREKEILARDGAEGPEWELLVGLHYVPQVVAGGKKVLDLYADAEFDGDPSSTTYVPLGDRKRYVQFGMSRGPKHQPFTLMDRFVLGVHVQHGWHGRRRHDRCLVTLAVQLQGHKAQWVEHQLELETTRKKPKAKDPRAKLTWKVGKQQHWLKDVRVVLPKRGDTADSARNLTWRSTFFLVPEPFSNAGEFRLSKMLGALREQLDAPAPLPTAPRTDHVAFAAKGWEKYSSVLKVIAQKSALILGWQEQHAKLSQRDAAELQSYQQVVVPVVRALEGVPFKTRNVNWAGRSDTKLSKLHVPAEHQTTWAKVLVLHRIEEQIARHAAEALQLFAEDDFQDVFFGRVAGQDPFLGLGLELRWSHTRDRLKEKKDGRARSQLDPLERARGGDASSERITLTIPAATFVYDGALKSDVLSLVTKFLPLLVPAPGSPAAADPEAVVGAQRRRIELFRRALEPAMRQVYEVLADETGKARVDFLTDDLDRAHVWKVGMHGAPSSLMYGGDLLKAEMAQVYQGPDSASGRPGGLHLFTDAELERSGQALKSRAGKYYIGHEFVFESSLATIKWLIKVHRFTTGELKWDAATALDAADLLVASGEIVLRAGALSSEFGLTMITSKGTPYYQIAGKIGAWLDVLKESYVLYKDLAAYRRGKPTDPVQVLFTVTNLLGMVLIALGASTIGGAIVAFVIAARALYDAFRITELEQVPAWYARTPWGEGRHYDYEDHSGKLLPSDPAKMFVEACKALTIFFSEVWEHLEAEQKRAIRDYFGEWAKAAGKSLQVRVTIKEDGDFFKLTDLRTY